MSGIEDSLDLWKTIEGADPKFLKDFTRGGGFRGTAIDPMFRVRRLTEELGPVGIGGGWTILVERIDGGIHWMRIKLWYLYCGERGEFESIGCTTMFGKNKYGDFADEEAPKKSLTDAITKGLSFLGCCANVYMGEQVDNKYAAKKPRRERKPRQETPKKDTPPRDTQRASGKMTPDPVGQDVEEPPPWLDDDVPF